MDCDMSSTAQRLLHSFMRLGQSGWHQRIIAGCTPSEIKVLFCILRDARNDGYEMKVSEIGQRLHVTSPSITQLLKGLEAKGLIERNVDLADRRAVFARVTSEGQMVARKAERAFAESFNGLIDYLGEEQSNVLADLLSKTVHYFNDKAASANRAHWDGDDA
jgi:DNA-binding MarR family transcriptional regulator